MRKLKYLSICLLSALALTACEDDPTVINPDPGRPSTAPDGTASSKAMLSSEYCPNSDIVIFNPSDQESTDGKYYDYVQIKLPQALDHDIDLCVRVNPEYSSYDFKSKHYLECQDIPNSDVLLINDEKECITTIKAGETISEKIKLTFISDELPNIKRVSYLLPIEVSEVSSKELYCTGYYLFSLTDKNNTSFGSSPGLGVLYVNTETMTPLIAGVLKYEIIFYNDNEGTDELIYSGPIVNIVNLRPAFVKNNNGLVKIELSSDLDYTLKNRFRYVDPLKNNGIKVCICVQGGGSGIGYANMTDKQIEDFTQNLKVIIDMYGLDGVNLYDVGAGYDKEGAAPVNGESYAKLIKAIKTAMPDKLLTLVDTRETTEALCDPVAGISVGDYLDYAWSDLEKFTSPYDPNESVRPLANLSENKYGTMFIRDKAQFRDEWDQLTIDFPFIQDIDNGENGYIHGTDVFVVHDIPAYTTAIEGCYSEPWMYWIYAHYPANEDFTEYTDGRVIITCGKSYNMFKKDW